jgi:hypothetical protein
LIETIAAVNLLFTWPQAVDYLEQIALKCRNRCSSLRVLMLQIKVVVPLIFFTHPFEVEIRQGKTGDRPLKTGNLFSREISITKL